MNINKIPLDNRKLLNGALLTGTAPYYEYQNGQRTSNVLGYKYNVVIPDLGYERLSVKVPGNKALDVEDDAIPVKFEDVEARMYNIDGRVDMTISASAIVSAKSSAPARQ